MTSSLRIDLAARISAIARQLRTKRPMQRERKAHQDYVTEVDHLADRLVSGTLAELMPGVPIFSEERPWPAQRPTSYWVIDPIDGTGNLLAGLPFVAISAALVEGGQSRLACIAALFTEDVFTAEFGRGSYLGETQLSAPDDPPELITVSSGILDRTPENPQLLQDLRSMGKFRNLGSQALQLASVAAGRLGANISEEARLWDDAAGQLIVEEAGMVYRAQPSGLGPDDRQRSFACHPALAPDLAQIASSLWDDDATQGAMT